MTALREIRTAAGASLDDVCRATGLDRSHLSRVERGLSGLTVASLARVVWALGMSAAELERVVMDHLDLDDVALRKVELPRRRKAEPLRPCRGCGESTTNAYFCTRGCYDRNRPRVSA